jgi:predicted nucleotidyltransferase
MGLARLNKINTVDQIWARRLEAIVAKIRSVSAEADIYVFGSFARNQFTAESDLDIAVVSAKKTRDWIGLSSSLVPYTDWPVDIVFLERSVFEAKKSIGGICFDIAHEGKLLSEGIPFNGHQSAI